MAPWSAARVPASIWHATLRSSPPPAANASRPADWIFQDLDPRLNWATLSQAERDAAYDNNAAVKNSAALIAVRNQASEALRASRKSSLDVPYGDRERTKIDLYPAGDKAAPCLVFLHGGYWQRNSPPRHDIASR